MQFLDFDREAASLEDGILSAVADAEKVEGVEVVRLADAASLRWRTSQSGPIELARASGCW